VNGQAVYTFIWYPATLIWMEFRTWSMSLRGVVYKHSQISV